jgi:hypothetical protein
MGVGVIITVVQPQDLQVGRANGDGRGTGGQGNYIEAG